ncbi:MAG: restriction endonuclease subunit S, partial [Gammaproteobacteria bacterium]
MAANFETLPLSDLLAPERKISYGIVQPGSHVDGGVPIVRVADIRNGQVSTENPLCVADSREAPYERTRLTGGELLLTLVGTVGEAAVAPESLKGWNVARAVAVVPIDEVVGAKWVTYALKTPEARQTIYGRLNTTVQATLNLRDVAQIPIVLPDQCERRSIENTLSTLDDKIDINRRMNETLEAMARAIFQSWFVDFDPVRAKASGESTESICRRLHLTPELLALFPDRLVDSELGEIPEGWEPATIADFCKLNADTWKTKSLPAEVHYVDLANTKNGVISDIQVFATEDAPSRARRVLHDGDTIIGTVRPGNRSYALIGSGDQQLTGSTGFAVLTPERGNLREFVYLVVTCNETIERLSHLADGAAYPAVRPDVVTAGTSVR